MPNKLVIQLNNSDYAVALRNALGQNIQQYVINEVAL